MAVSNLVVAGLHLTIRWPLRGQVSSSASASSTGAGVLESEQREREREKERKRIQK